MPGIHIEGQEGPTKKKGRYFIMSEDIVSIRSRNIVLAIIFSIITCGIYGIYWFICITNDMEAVTPEDDYQTSGGMAFLFSIITCGIYGWYWNYRMGRKMDSLKGGNHSILFLILAIFGLGIVNYCIMQGELNTRAAA
jgi:hypothetical protein